MNQHNNSQIEASVDVNLLVKLSKRMKAAAVVLAARQICHVYRADANAVLLVNHVRIR